MPNLKLRRHGPRSKDEDASDVRVVFELQLQTRKPVSERTVNNKLEAIAATGSANPTTPSPSGRGGRRIISSRKLLTGRLHVQVAVIFAPTQLLRSATSTPRATGTAAAVELSPSHLSGRPAGGARTT